MELNLKGRRALVTGAHRGTGQIIAQKLAAEGAEVYVQGPDEAALAETRALIPTAKLAPGDIETDVGADAVAAACGDIDILINNMGSAERGKWGALSMDQWIKQYEHNVLSGVRLIDRFSPHMQAQSFGRIIALGTVGTTAPNKVMPHYYAAKGALVTMMASLAKALGGTGVTCNTVSPGLIATDEIKAAYTMRAKKRGEPDDWASVEPAVAKELGLATGHIPTREEVADLVVFLASSRASAITGQSIRIDGGMTGTVV
ncbi:MAG: SDR family NAD(P)-dependent oxidoreductase [Alphaproteobacteria bacterium]